MFTGLVQTIGTVKRVSRGAMTDLWVDCSFPSDDYKLGESIACDGCCLTVAEHAGTTFKVQASPETLRCTTLATWKVGTRINLEKALRMGDRMGGHWVQGHVDGVARLVERRPEGGTTVMGFSFAPELARFFIEKGSVTVDGVSLTVNRLDAARFFVALIPETLERTSLGDKQPGATVNLETDLVGKYVAKLVPPR